MKRESRSLSAVKPWLQLGRNSVFLLQWCTLPQQGSGFKTQGFLHQLEQVWTLSSHILGGRSSHALRLCLPHPSGGAMQPAARSERRLQRQQLPTTLQSGHCSQHSFCSAVPDESNEMSNSCVLWGTGRGFPGLPHPREGRPEWQAHDETVWAELLWCRAPDQVEGIRCSWHSSVRCHAGAGVWTKGVEEWPRFVCQFSLWTACAFSLPLLSFLKMLIKKKKKNKIKQHKTLNRVN